MNTFEYAHVIDTFLKSQIWEIIKTFSGYALALISGIFALREKIARRKSDAALNLIRRRCQAPLLVVDADTRFNIFSKNSDKPHILNAYQPGISANLLCFARDEVDPNLQDDDEVLLVIRNIGQDAQKIKILLDGNPIKIQKEPSIDGSHGLIALEYPYQSSMRGKRQLIKVWFESSGVQDTHIYETFHGQRVLNRIDPA